MNRMVRKTFSPFMVFFPGNGVVVDPLYNGNVPVQIISNENGRISTSSVCKAPKRRDLSSTR